MDESINQRLREISRESHRAAIIAGAAFIVILAALLYAALKIRSLEQAVVLGAPISGGPGLLRLPSMFSVEGIEPRVTKEVLENPADAQRPYRFAVRLNLPEGMKTEIQEVLYTFKPVDKFPHVPKMSSEPSNGFEVAYDGYGCSNEVVVTLVMRNGGRVSKPFDQCAALDKLENAEK